MKDTLIEMKNNLQGIKSGVDEAENQNKILNIRKKKTTNLNNKKKKIQNSKDSVRSLWDNFKCSNIDIVGLSEEKRKHKKLEIYLKK